MLLVSAALVLVSVLVALLFAMLAELSHRVNALTLGSDQAAYEVATGVPVGIRPSAWPDNLRQVGELSMSAVLVLSAACGTCRRIAMTLTPKETFGCPLLLLVTGATVSSATELIAGQPIDGFPHHIDPSGSYAQDTLSVTTSPCLLLLERGVVTAAFFGNCSRPAGEVYAGAGWGGVQGPVVKSWRSTSRRLMPCLPAVWR